MRNFVLAIGTASALISSMAVSGNLQAASYANERIKTGLDETGLVENVQYVWQGRTYCWYDDGWQGPGWYWCGYRHREGLGWGGGRGWRNWERREWREERHEDRREDRHERREEHRDRY
jgi:hypothetical protein